MYALCSLLAESHHHIQQRGRPRTAWMDNIKTWTGLSVKKSIRMTEDREINGESTSVVWPTLGSRTAKEQNRTEQNTAVVAVPRWDRGWHRPLQIMASLHTKFSQPPTMHTLWSIGSQKKSSKFDATRCRVAQLVKCLVTSGYPDGSSSGGPERAWKVERLTSCSRGARLSRDKQLTEVVSL